MTKQKINKEENLAKDKISFACEDRLCPAHGRDKLKLRGRIFHGNVAKKFHRRVVIEFERVLYIPKYERYEKRKTILHARLPDCMKEDIQVGDLIEVAECRPISKIIHAIATKKMKGKLDSKDAGGKNESS
jgi:small subunit ribosomal protein S17